MLPSRRTIYLKTSIALSLVSLTLSGILNYKIAGAYLRADGKTKALFSIIETFQFGYQYYIALVCLGAFILAVVSNIKEQPFAKRFILALWLSLLAGVIVFARIWRIMV